MAFTRIQGIPYRLSSVGQWEVKADQLGIPSDRMLDVEARDAIAVMVAPSIPPIPDPGSMVNFHSDPAVDEHRWMNCNDGACEEEGGQQCRLLRAGWAPETVSPGSETMSISR